MMIGYMRPFFEAPACERQADVLGTYDLRIEEHGSSK